MKLLEPIANLLMTILILLLATILGLYIWAQATGRGTTHEQILERLDAIERQNAFQSCLIQLPSEMRTAEQIAACTAVTAPTIPP